MSILLHKVYVKNGPQGGGGDQNAQNMFTWFMDDPNIFLIYNHFEYLFSYFFVR